MPRTSETVEVGDVIAVEPPPDENQAEIEGPRASPSRKRRRIEYPRPEKREIDQFTVYCPCRSCALRPEPTPRLLKIVKDHIRLNRLSNKWKVTVPTIILVLAA